jgi:hypothetical protein
MKIFGQALMACAINILGKANNIKEKKESFCQCSN